jgi:predicted ferric reductase
MTVLAPSATVSASATLHERTRRRRRRARLADLLGVLVWASAALAAALYLSSGLVDLSGPAGVITAGGILAGLVGSDLVLVMLVLAARVPLIDRAVGHDRAMSVHRALGKPALYLLLAHGALLTVGYGLADGHGPLAETWALLAGEDMPLAYVSIALFVTVVVTSIVVVRRRLPYEVWHVVHLLSYAAVLAGLPHQLSQGGVLVTGTPQRVYWISLYVLALGAIIVFRVARPLATTVRHGVRVAAVERVSADAVTIHLTGRDIDRLGAQGGQFFFWRFLSRQTWWHAHPISLSAEPERDHARLTVRIAGHGTARLATLAPGTRVALSGPFGLFTDSERQHGHVALLAAGIGITPIRAMLDRLDLPAGAATLVMRATSWEEVYLWPELRAWADATGHRLYASVGPRAQGVDAWLSAGDVARGATTAAVLPDLIDSDVFICGPGGWADAVEHRVRQLGVANADVHRERFDS